MDGGSKPLDSTESYESSSCGGSDENNEEGAEDSIGGLQGRKHSLAYRQRDV